MRVEPTIAALLRAVWPKNTAKHAAAAADRSHRTAERWVQGRDVPNADILLRMARRNDEMRAELARLLGETDAVDHDVARPRPGSGAALDTHGPGAPALTA